MNDLPTDLTQFRLEPQDSGVVHLVFDCPGRSMNVFSNKAIHELGKVAEWLHSADVAGLLIRSGKESGFCAGADLTELGVAYDMIVSAPEADRFDIGYDHFFPLGHAIRRLETSGKPIAAAIGGVALGGGCELALGAHYRVLADTPRAVLGLPECQIGLLPGAGGTQRMPRLVGVEIGLQVLLQGRTLSGADAIDAGLADALVAPGEELAAAEAWLLSDKARSVQPWDMPGARLPVHADYAAVIERHRERELQRMLGHEPAPIAILDCVELGLMQPMDGAIRSEMSVFAGLIQRPEPRNMIRTLFLGKQAFDKARRSDSISPAAQAAAEMIGEQIEAALNAVPDLRSALFGASEPAIAAVQDRPGPQPWLMTQDRLLDALRDVADRSREAASAMTEPELLQLDHLVTVKHGVPGYVGGVSGLANLPM